MFFRAGAVRVGSRRRTRTKSRLFTRAASSSARRSKLSGRVGVVRRGPAEGPADEALDAGGPAGDADGAGGLPDGAGGSPDGASRFPGLRGPAGWLAGASAADSGGAGGNAATSGIRPA